MRRYGVQEVSTTATLSPCFLQASRTRSWTNLPSGSAYNRVRGGAIGNVIETAGECNRSRYRALEPIRVPTTSCTADKLILYAYYSACGWLGLCRLLGLSAGATRRLLEGMAPSGARLAFKHGPRRDRRSHSGPR